MRYKQAGRTRFENDLLDKCRNNRNVVSGFISLIAHLLLLLLFGLIVVVADTKNPALTLLDSNHSDEADSLILIPELDSVQQVVDFAELQLEPTSATALTSSNLNLSLASKANDKQRSAELEPIPAGAASRSAAKGIDLSSATAPSIAAIQGRVVKAGGKKGEVQFALAWKNINDLDLHVITPTGEHISHMHRRSECSGLLDVDMNVKGESEEPVENVRWITKAPWGRYTVLVNLFKINTDGSRRPKRQSAYQVLAQLGSESMVREGTASPGQQQVTVWRFQYIPARFSTYEREQMLDQLTMLQTQEESAAAPMLAEAKSVSGPLRERQLQNIVRTYPHTDAAVEALQLMGGEVVKR